MATYRQIQDWVKAHHGFVPKTCWIAHCKELCGMERRTAPNRQGPVRVHPCPPEKRQAIMDAFVHLGMLPGKPLRRAIKREPARDIRRRPAAQAKRARGADNLVSETPSEKSRVSAFKTGVAEVAAREFGKLLAEVGCAAGRELSRLAEDGIRAAFTKLKKSLSDRRERKQLGARSPEARQ